MSQLSPRAADRGNASVIGRTTRLGELLVELGYLRPEQLAAALERQKGQMPQDRQPLGHICVSMGFITSERLGLILDRWGKRLRLGEIMVHRGRITQAQLVTALAEQQRGGRRLGEILLEQGAIQPEALAETLSEHFDIPYVPLAGLPPERDLVRYVNEIFATRHRLVPIGRLGRQITVAIADPTRRDVARDLERSTGMKVRLVLSTPQEVADFSTLLYRGAGKDGGVAAEPSAPKVAATSAADEVRSSRDYFRHLLTSALSQSATAISLEPAESGGIVRASTGTRRIEIPRAEFSGERLAGIIFDLKRLAHLDAAENRRPQEGILVVQTEEGDFSKAVSLHLTTVPGPTGESAHLRILDRKRPSRTFEEVGLLDSTARRLGRAIQGASGLFLIAGPPGSGKRSTLRACASVLRRNDSRLMSIEDPIVFVQDGITQVQIDPALGNTYARYLRSFLPLQPDAILMDHLDGEESAELALGAGDGGPLILATIRAANATDAVTRLCEMDVDTNLIVAGLTGVFGQRLMRRNCAHCSSPYEPSSSTVQQWFGSAPAPAGLRRGSGCGRCGGTGFLGRVVVSELWVPSDEEAAMIARRVSGPKLRESVVGRIGTLGHEAIRRVLAGDSTLEEALRAVPHGDLIQVRTRWPEMAEAPPDQDPRLRAA